MAQTLFACPHCGSEYRRTQITMSSDDDDFELCVVCAHIMDRWRGRRVPLFSLVTAAPSLRELP